MLYMSVVWFWLSCVLQPQASMGQFPAGQPPMYNPQYQQQPGITVNV